MQEFDLDDGDVHVDGVEVVPDDDESFGHVAAAAAGDDDTLGGADYHDDMADVGAEEAADHGTDVDDGGGVYAQSSGVVQAVAQPSSSVGTDDQVQQWWAWGGKGYAPWAYGGGKGKAKGGKGGALWDRYGGAYIDGGYMAPDGSVWQ